MLITPTITIRSASPGDARAVLRLAVLDSQTVPPEPLLLAEEDGELVAALSLSSGRMIADPFRRTAHLADLLARRAAVLQASTRDTGRP